MKRFFYAAFAGVVVLFAACTKKEVEAPAENQQPEVVKSTPVYITAGIDPETTKSMLNESNGAFGFTVSDVIKIWDGTATAMVQSESVAPDGSDVSKATIAFPAGFDEDGTASGWFTAFPASLVSNIEADGVTFTLPASYKYDEVGHEDPNFSSVPCPMIGTYISGSTISYKQAGAVIRFRLTNLTAGSLTFMFETPVTGSIKLIGVPSGTNDGIVAGSMDHPGNSITVTGVPEVTSGNYIFVTLPVPSGTAPQHIAVINESNSAKNTRMATLNGSSTPLNRAGGWKMGVTPVEVEYTFQVAAGKSVVVAPGNLMAKISSFTRVNKEGQNVYDAGYATASEWKFGGYFEVIGGTSAQVSNPTIADFTSNLSTGNDYLSALASTDGQFQGMGVTDAAEIDGYRTAWSNALQGKWVDLFLFQGASADQDLKHHGLVNNGGNAKRWNGNVAGESIYENCWNTESADFAISNGGGFAWRPMTKEEWEYLLDGRESTGGATIGNKEHALHGRATVAGIKGLLIFPDGLIWNNGGSDCGSDELNIAMNEIAASAGLPSNLNVYENGSEEYDFVISYTAYQFATMAQCRIVFLPCAGYRGGRWVHMEDGNARYWSSSSDGTTSAYNLSFRKDKVKLDSEGRAVGRSVRLVRDVTTP